MAKWSGAGIPPTRRKLHRHRLQQRLEREAALKAARGEDAFYARSWQREYRGGDRLIAFWLNGEG